MAQLVSTKNYIDNEWWSECQQRMAKLKLMSIPLYIKKMTNEKFLQSEKWSAKMKCCNPKIPLKASRPSFPNLCECALNKWTIIFIFIISYLRVYYMECTLVYLPLFSVSFHQISFSHSKCVLIKIIMDIRLTCQKRIMIEVKAWG